ncbi:hypothetical protein PYCC9005_003268 [Savitreella phatthalungensis]
MSGSGQAARRPLPRASSIASLPLLEEEVTGGMSGEENGQLLEPDLRDFVTQIIDSFPKWSEGKRRKDTDDLVTYLEDKLGLYTVPSFYERFTKDDEHGLDIDKLQILPCERPIKTKLIKFFVHGEPATWRESMHPTRVDKGTNPILRPHQEEPFTYSAKSYLRGPFAIVRSAMTTDNDIRRVALKEYSPEIDVSFDIMIQNLMLPHPNALRTICTYRTTRTGKVVQKMAMEPWCDYRLEDVIAAGAYGLDLVLRVGYCLGSLLYHIHCHGVKHVNINPRNILLTEQGGIYLSDLSTSRIYVEDDVGDGMVTPSLSMAKSGDPLAGRLAHPTSVSTMSHLTIQTDLFYTAPEQKVDVSRRGTDIWMLGVTLLELLYGLAEQESASEQHHRPIRDAAAFGYMVAALPQSELNKKLDDLPAMNDANDEKLRLELMDIVRQVLVQQPRDRPSAYEIHQRLARFANAAGRELPLNEDPDLPPIEHAKDVIRASIPYSVHEHTTIKGEDDALVDLSRGEKKVRFDNKFQVEEFERLEHVSPEDSGGSDDEEDSDGEDEAHQVAARLALVNSGRLESDDEMLNSKLMQAAAKLGERSELI